MDNKNAVPKKNIIDALRKELTKFAPREQVLLSFIGDPYCVAEERNGITRDVLELLWEYHVPTAILTKGGSRCLRDAGIFARFEAPLKVGASLTFMCADDSRDTEPFAAEPGDRIEALEALASLGVKTWVSLEPVIDPRQTLRLIAETHRFVDEYRVGKMNHHPLDVDWAAFGYAAVEMLRTYGKAFYVKEDLRKYISITLTDDECDMNRLNLGAAK